jgi:hypothetical protein
MLRAALLDQEAYRDVARDPVGLAQAIVVVLLASVATVVGLALDAHLSGEHTVAEGIGRGLVIMPGLWALQAGSAFLFGALASDVGTQQTTARGLAAAIGYSAAPGVLLALAPIPEAGEFIAALVFTLWMLISTIVALRSTAASSYVRAIMAVLPGFLLRVIIVTVVMGTPGAV